MYIYLYIETDRPRYTEKRDVEKVHFKEALIDCKENI